MTPHRYDCRVRFSDVDVYGHVNNVKYFEYYQEARIAFINSLGHDPGDPELNLVVARLDVDYRRPILFRNDPYLIETRVTRVGGSSFGLAAEIKDGDQVLSRAQAVMVAVEPDSHRARPLTERERERLGSVIEA